MIHELLTIKNNRVDLKLAHLPPESREVVLSADEDAFFNQIMYRNFGEVAEDIHNHVQKFLDKKKSVA